MSTDYVNDARSSIVDAASTMVVGDSMVKIYAWYQQQQQQQHHHHHHHHHNNNNNNNNNNYHNHHHNNRYDNEAGYSMRTAELARIVAKRWLGA